MARGNRVHLGRWWVLGLIVLLQACGGGASDAGSNAELIPAQSMSPKAELGRLIFQDPNLSASGTQSCASCHAASHGHAAPNALAVQLGGAGGSDQHGTRSSPSMRYLKFNTAFHFDSEGTPTGGFFWDGRANSLAEQAKGPFLNPREMANANERAVIDKLAQASYAPAFKQAFGRDVLNDTAQAFESIAQALQAFQEEDAQFASFTSRYDDYLRGQATLNEQELRGLALFNAPDKGNCAACHPSAKGADGSFPLFTDFTYDSLGVPRNFEIAENQDPAYFDLGLCDSTNPAIRALADDSRQGLCGAFKVPSLRNVALRQRFFHNGVFDSLTKVVRFYVTRDTHPENWYVDRQGRVDRDAEGNVVKYNDVPVAYRAFVNTSEPPYDRKPGEAPALNENEIADVVAFLATLTDRDRP